MYLGAGVLFAIPALLALVWPAWPGSVISGVIALLVLGVALFASDALLNRVHRIFWRREWPK
jgi:hypothetical protein